MVVGYEIIKTMELLGNLFACGICPESFSTPTDLLNHVQTEHELDESSKYKDMQKRKVEIEIKSSFEVKRKNNFAENVLKDHKNTSAWNSNHNPINCNKVDYDKIFT